MILGFNNMYLSYRFKIDKSDEPYKELKRLTSISKDLYNQTIYKIQDIKEKDDQYVSKYDIRSIMKEVVNLEGDINYRKLPSQISMEVVFLAWNSVNSFFKSMKKWKKNPEKFMGKPDHPKYLEKNSHQVISIPNQTCKITDDGHIVFDIRKKYTSDGVSIKIPEKEFKKKRHLLLGQSFKSIRVVPLSRADFFMIEICYKTESKEIKPNNNVVAIDIGVNNLMSITDNIGNVPIIINGKPLKSINQYFNKISSKYKSDITKNKKKNKSTRKSRDLFNKRNFKIKDYMHKATKYLMTYCQKNEIKKIVIGYNGGWKQSINIGKKNNQNFTSIPFLQMINMIQYKAEYLGINVELVNESYTSKCSAIDLEPIEKNIENQYMGKRVHRGLFKSSDGTVINADINASLNIMRKVIGDEFIKSNISNYIKNPIKVTMQK